jgi:hypothetical protein
MVPDGTLMAGVAAAQEVRQRWCSRAAGRSRRAGFVLTLVLVNWTRLRMLPSVESYKPVVPLAKAISDRAREGDLIAHYDVALPSMVFYLERRVEIVWSREEFLRMVRSGRPAFAVLPEDRYRELAGEIGGLACVVDRRPTFDAKLREVLARRAPPAMVLVSTRCPPGR